MSEMVIRKSEHHDAHDLAEYCFSANTEEEVLDRLRYYDDLGEDGYLYVAEIDGRVIGTASVSREGPTATINSVVVNSSYQKRGIARRLFESIENAARDWGVQTMKVGARVGAASAIVYERLGYVGVETVNGVVKFEKLLVLSSEKP